MRIIIAVGLLAIGISLAIGETSETAKTLQEIEARTCRMMANPSPHYDRYPNPVNESTSSKTTPMNDSSLMYDVACLWVESKPTEE